MSETTGTQKKKLSIIAFSGDFDKAVAAFTLATGAAAVNYEVNVFFTFFGFDIIKKKKGRAPIGKGLGRVFNFLLGGFNNLPLSRLNLGGLSPRIMTRMMKKKNVATLQEMLDASVELGVNLYACEMSMNIFGTTLANYHDAVKEVLGVPKFLQIAEGGQIIFIS
jgi:peroxiredoxin family protein